MAGGSNRGTARGTGERHCGADGCQGSLEPRRYLGQYPGRRLRPPLPARGNLAHLGVVACFVWPRGSTAGGSTGPTWPVLPARPLQRQDPHGSIYSASSPIVLSLTSSPKSETPLLSSIFPRSLYPSTQTSPYLRIC
jgi:hypothetical protein